jgi:hypothetical protein
MQTVRVLEWALFVAKGKFSRLMVEIRDRHKQMQGTAKAGKCRKILDLQRVNRYGYGFSSEFCGCSD